MMKGSSENINGHGANYLSNICFWRQKDARLWAITGMAKLTPFNIFLRTADILSLLKISLNKHIKVSKWQVRKKNGWNKNFCFAKIVYMWSVILNT